MSEARHRLVDPTSAGYSYVRPEVQRAIAVAAALELIQTRISANSYSEVIDEEISKLSNYADQIQEALKVK